jgi:hypothetical protein
MAMKWRTERSLYTMFEHKGIQARYHLVCASWIERVCKGLGRPFEYPFGSARGFAISDPLIKWLVDIRDLGDPVAQSLA